MFLGWHERFPDVVPRLTVEQYEKWLQRSQRNTPVVNAAVDFAKKKRAEGVTSCYIAGPLTYVKDEEKERYVRTAEICDRHKFFGYVPHLHLTDPQKNPLVTPVEVRDIDFLWAAVMADFHINFLYPVAQGNGIEEGWAEDRHIPTIYVAPADLRLSRLVEGMQNRIHTILYRDVAECYQMLDAYLGLMRWWLDQRPGRGVVGFIETRLELS